MSGPRGVVSRGNLADQAGMPPVPFDGHQTHKDLVADRSTQTFVKPGRNSEGHRTSANRSASGFNLRGVVEVLEDAGLDPVVELARILQERVPVVDAGQVVLDPKTGDAMTKPALAIDLRTRVLTELTNFIHPKLKAVEMTVKKPELTEEQLDARLAALLLKKAKKALD